MKREILQKINGRKKSKNNISAKSEQSGESVI